jgi:hypothetical protein
LIARATPSRLDSGADFICVGVEIFIFPTARLSDAGQIENVVSQF